jgi:hypothetical protein
MTALQHGIADFLIVHGGVHEHTARRAVHGLPKDVDDFDRAVTLAVKAARTLAANAAERRSAKLAGRVHGRLVKAKKAKEQLAATQRRHALVVRHGEDSQLAQALRCFADEIEAAHREHITLNMVILSRLMPGAPGMGTIRPQSVSVSVEAVPEDGIYIRDRQERAFVLPDPPRSMPPAAFLDRDLMELLRVPAARYATVESTQAMVRVHIEHRTVDSGVSASLYALGLLEPSMPVSLVDQLWRPRGADFSIPADVLSIVLVHLATRRQYPDGPMLVDTTWPPYPGAIFPDGVPVALVKAWAVLRSVPPKVLKTLLATRRDRKGRLQPRVNPKRWPGVIESAIETMLKYLNRARWENWENTDRRINWSPMYILSWVYKLRSELPRRLPGRSGKERTHDWRNADKIAVEELYGNHCGHCGKSRLDGVLHFYLHHKFHNGGGRTRKIRTETLRKSILDYAELHDGTPPDDIVMWCGPCHTTVTATHAQEQRKAQKAVRSRAIGVGTPHVTMTPDCQVVATVRSDHGHSPLTLTMPVMVTMPSRPAFLPVSLALLADAPALARRACGPGVVVLDVTDSGRKSVTTTTFRKSVTNSSKPLPALKNLAEPKLTLAFKKPVVAGDCKNVLSRPSTPHKPPRLEVGLDAWAGVMDVFNRALASVPPIRVWPRAS